MKTTLLALVVLVAACGGSPDNQDPGNTNNHPTIVKGASALVYSPDPGPPQVAQSEAIVAVAQQYLGMTKDQVIACFTDKITITEVPVASCPYDSYLQKNVCWPVWKVCFTDGTCIQSDTFTGSSFPNKPTSTIQVFVSEPTGGTCFFDRTYAWDITKALQQCRDGQPFSFGTSYSPDYGITLDPMLTAIPVCTK